MGPSGTGAGGTDRSTVRSSRVGIPPDTDTSGTWAWSVVSPATGADDKVLSRTARSLAFSGRGSRRGRGPSAVLGDEDGGDADDVVDHGAPDGDVLAGDDEHALEQPPFGCLAV